MKTTVTSSRSGFTLVEIMIVVAIFGILVSVALPNFLKSRTQAQKQTCISNLSQIETAKQVWGVEHGKKDGDVPSDADLIGPTLYIKIKPQCPGGGTYNYQPIGTIATCNIAGHVLQ
jgi:prepilin-type N-terminal cleavage/methylation domain-containing protein